MADWTDALIRAGAPVLRDLVKNQIGGIGGQIAGGIIDQLAESLSVPQQSTPEATGEKIAQKIDSDPSSAVVVQQVEQDFVRVIEASTPVMLGYQSLLREDAQAQGILSRLWKPLFAICFTFCYTATIFTILWLLWTRQSSSLGNFNEITGFLTFAFIAGCAVLGIQVWRQTASDKK